MSERETLFTKAGRYLFASPSQNSSPEPKQRRLMAIALALLLFALSIVLYHDRDFWFPDTEQADEQPEQALPVTSAAMQAAPEKPAKVVRKKPATGKPQLTASAQPADSDPPIVATATRTVLPPLEVEVVAGDVHRTMHPATPGIQVELQPEAPAETAVDAPATADDTAADVTDKAAERVQMSADTSDAVSEPVKPNYPMLARQMKVQGSVILLALISREGQIQDLRILSGPPILSSAAREAVKQWHFKPHYEGADAVETAARITVNFTISTN